MEQLLEELNPYIVQALGTLILALAAAVAAMLTAALNSLRQWLNARKLFRLRLILDDAVNNAKKAFPPETLERLSSEASDVIADQMVNYLKATMPGTLAKLKVDDAGLKRRMLQEAIQMLRNRYPNTTRELVGK